MRALLIALMLLSASDAFAERAAIRRFALIVGMNHGGQKRVELRYATEDAKRMANVLEELGGVSEFDRTVLLTADRAQLEAALTSLKTQIAAAKAPGALRQLIFYYSGHSDGEGLMLGSEHVKYGDLRKMLSAVGADIQIAILDSCASGALVRAKGGKARPPFLLDQSSKVRGHVFLTSSSENEVAQESDRIGGSFFTHYLISGLRGAADASRDGKVTLNEAYQFAFDETLRRTEQTTGGPQHASYDIQLAGTGDLVITDLRESAARLAFGAELEGRFYVRDESGRLIAELYKARGLPAELGLEPGKYQVTQEHEDKLRVATLEVKKGDVEELLALAETSAEDAVARGDQEEEAPFFPVGFSVIPMVSTAGFQRITTNFALDALWGAYANVYGTHLSGVVAQIDRDLEGAQIAGVVSYVGGDFRGAQLAGTFNWAGSFEGAQIGPVNATRDMVGAQVGVVNIGSGRGVQIGLINIASEFEGFRLGLVNFSDATVARAAAWGGETDPFEIGLKLRDGALYTLFSAGTGSFGKDGPWTFGFGLGGEIPLDPFFIDIDVIALTVHRSEKFAHAEVVPFRARIIVGWRIFDRLAIIAGITGTLALNIGDGSGTSFYAPGYAKKLNDDLSIWPGFVVGLEI